MSYISRYDAWQTSEEIAAVWQIIDQQAEVYYEELKGADGKSNTEAYEIAREKAFDEAKDTLDLLEMDRDEKIEQLVGVYKQAAAMKEGIEKEIKTFKKRAEHEEAVMKDIAELIRILTAGKAVKTPSFEVKYSTSHPVEIIAKDKLPLKYLRVELSKIAAESLPEELADYVKAYEPDKTLIKADIKAGLKVPGAMVVEKKNINIK